MFARVSLTSDIPSAVRVVSCPVDVLTKGDVHERLKSGSTLVRLWLEDESYEIQR